MNKKRIKFLLERMRKINQRNNTTNHPKRNQPQHNQKPLSKSHQKQNWWHSSTMCHSKKAIRITPIPNSRYRFQWRISGNSGTITRDQYLPTPIWRKKILSTTSRARTVGFTSHRSTSTENSLTGTAPCKETLSGPSGRTWCIPKYLRI